MTRSKEPRTRFVCQLPSQISQILWARENDVGDVQLGLNFAERYTPDHLHDRATPVLNQKYSLHPSNNATSATLNGTLMLANGVPIKGAAFQTNLSRLVYPLFVKACPDLSNLRYAITPRPSDTVLVVGSMNTPVVLVYGVIITNREIDLRHLIRWHTVDAVFTHFRITVAAAYLLLVPSNEGSLRHLITNNVTVDGVHTPFDASGLHSLDSPSPEGGVARLEAMMESIRIAHIRKLRRLLTPSQWMSVKRLLPIDRLVRDAPRTR
jgi:hypothetical protein